MSGKWGTMVLIGIIVSLITGACTGLSWLGVGAVALLLITGPLSLGVASAHLKLVRGENVEVGDAFGGFKNFGNAFLLSLLMKIFTILWTLLFVIPGIIAMYRYAMSYYILSDNPTMDGNSARKRSIEMMRGNKWRLFCLDFSFIGWYLLSILTLGILALWVAPYHEAARAEFYQDLLRMQSGNGYDPQGVNVNGQPQSGESAFGAGYNPNPDIELGGNESDVPDKAESRDDKKGGEEGSAPINADDL